MASVKAKEVSKFGQIIAFVYMLTMSILKGLGIMDLSAGEIVLLAGGMVIVFTPVYLSIWLEKMASKMADSGSGA